MGGFPDEVTLVPKNPLMFVSKETGEPIEFDKIVMPLTRQLPPGTSEEELTSQAETAATAF